MAQQELTLISRILDDVKRGLQAREGAIKQRCLVKTTTTITDEARP
jgi:hypothetical protein